jgi:hypothetical protein
MLVSPSRNHARLTQMSGKNGVPVSAVMGIYDCYSKFMPVSNVFVKSEEEMHNWVPLVAAGVPHKMPPNRGVTLRKFKRRHLVTCRLIRSAPFCTLKLLVNQVLKLVENTQGALVDGGSLTGDGAFAVRRRG